MRFVNMRRKGACKIHPSWGGYISVWSWCYHQPNCGRNVDRRAKTGACELVSYKSIRVQETAKLGRCIRCSKVHVLWRVHCILGTYQSKILQFFARWVSCVLCWLPETRTCYSEANTRTFYFFGWNNRFYLSWFRLEVCYWFHSFAGVLPPEEIVRQAIDILRKKLEMIQREQMAANSAPAAHSY